MRLKIEMSSEKVTLPLNYQPVLQGLIYNAFDRDGYGSFLHDTGYQHDKKVFKLFVFSNLFGKYSIENNRIIFEDKFYFYVSSETDEFIQNIIQFYIDNRYVNLNGQKVEVTGLQIIDLPYFEGEIDITIRSISPVVSYRTEGNYVHYFKPSDKEFFSLCLANLLDKNEVIDIPVSNIVFSINEVLKERKRLVKFKNTFYVSYMCELNIHTNFETLSLLYNTGLSSKGSAGFGMIEVKL